MFTAYNLSEPEKALLLELLEREMADLPVEIRHTRSSTMREELHERLNLVREMADRLRVPAAV
jgi:hypothetical protein